MPLLLIVYDRTPPSPATADISALAPLPLKSVTATDTGFLYPEPNVRLCKYSNAVPDPTYACDVVLEPKLIVKVVDDKIPVKPKDLSFAIERLGLNVNPSNLTNSLILLKS